MAIIKCPECGKEVSDRAAACPGCGYPINQGAQAVSTSTMREADKPEAILMEGM